MSTKPLTETSNFRMPAEWEPHQATWLVWPHNPETWPGKLEAIPAIYATMVKALTEAEVVHICVENHTQSIEVKKFLSNYEINLQNVYFHFFPTNDSWIRDSGPIFVKNVAPVMRAPQTEGYSTPAGGDKDLIIIDNEFNMWGGKYPPWDHDNAIPQRIASKFRYGSIKTGIVLEGGSIDVNGEGELLTTQSCLLNPNRNPTLSKDDLEKFLKKHLGVHSIHWLGDGIVGDDTDGHVDDIARFVNATTIVAAVETNASDENFLPLKLNYEKLKTLENAQGEPFTIIPLPMPAPVEYLGQRLPASYANFYIANACVLVPVFDDPNDAKALSTLQSLFPEKKIVPIAARDLVVGLGACHCLTQQHPL